MGEEERKNEEETLNISKFPLCQLITEFPLHMSSISNTTNPRPERSYHLLHNTNIFPIISRCGVNVVTSIQPLEVAQGIQCPALKKTKHK